jgi:methylated-DNA-[protein]-cysteine S-methyltransferase
MAMISTHYYPPNDLPLISLTVKDGKLLLLDWYNDKTAQLFDKLGKQAVFVAPDKLDKANDDQAVALEVTRQLDEYFVGARQVFDIELDLSHGTPFQQMVWQALLQIPYGKTISYGELAAAIGKPTAYRACANANGRNPISLIVSCHRVIASDGGLGGYTGGVGIKRILLDIEKITTPKNPPQTHY